MLILNILSHILSFNGGISIYYQKVFFQLFKFFENGWYGCIFDKAYSFDFLLSVPINYKDYQVYEIVLR